MIPPVQLQPFEDAVVVIYGDIDGYREIAGVDFQHSLGALMIDRPTQVLLIVASALGALASAISIYQFYSGEDDG